jgi:hypothetical protein
MRSCGHEKRVRMRGVQPPNRAIPLAIPAIQVADVAGSTARADPPGVWSALALHLQQTKLDEEIS